MVQVTPRTRYGVRGGDETLKRRVAAKFAEGDVSGAVKVTLDGGTRPGDTLQILPLALAQPPNPRSITSYSLLRRHPSLTNRVGFFRVIQWGIHSQKIIIGTAICLKKNMHFR